MSTDTICEKIAESVKGKYSRFGEDATSELEDLLKQLVKEIRREVRTEMYQRGVKGF